VSQRNSVTVDVSSGSKCHSGRNVGGRNVKAPVCTYKRMIGTRGSKECTKIKNKLISRVCTIPYICIGGENMKRRREKGNNLKA
jgi:hypothetical protein